MSQNGTATHQPPTSRNAYSQQHQNSQRCKPIISRLIFVLVVLFLLCCVSVSIAWLMYHPRLPEVRLDSLTVSNFTLFKSNLMGEGNITVTLGNPNRKINLKLENFQVKVFYGKTLLSETDSMADPTYLRNGSKENSTAELRFEGKDGISGCEKVLKDKGWGRSNGAVSLEVKVFISTKFIAGEWLSARKSTWALCKVELSPATHGGLGKLLHGEKDCVVDFSYDS